MAQRRRGRPPAPPGSRKNPGRVVSARVPEELFRKLKDLAKQHGQVPSAQTVSAEIGRALKSWVKRYETPRLHNSRLAYTINVLADGIERLTGHSWINDPLTREVVRQHVEQLVAQLLPLTEPVTVPPDIKEQAGLILTVVNHATGSRRLAGTVIVDDPDLVMLTDDLARKYGTEANVETRPELVARRMRQKERK
jgi:hypothetical protein